MSNDEIEHLGSNYISEEEIIEPEATAVADQLSSSASSLMQLVLDGKLDPQIAEGLLMQQAMNLCKLAEDIGTNSLDASPKTTEGHGQFSIK